VAVSNAAKAVTAGCGDDPRNVSGLAALNIRKNTPLACAIQHAAPGAVAITEYLSGDEATAAVFHIHLRDAIHAVLQEHSFAKAFDYNRRAAAAHEAGHAVIYAAFGLSLERIQVQRRFIKGLETPVWVGCCETDRAPFTIDPANGPHLYIREICFLAAGALGELRLAPGGLLPGSSLDERVFCTMLCHTAETAFGWPEHAAGCLVGKIVKTLLSDFAAEHGRLTGRLLRNKVVRAAELGRLLAPVTAALGANEATFMSLVDDFLRLAVSTSAEGSAL
jgi:hypothetical protein